MTCKKCGRDIDDCICRTPLPALKDIWNVAGFGHLRSAAANK